MGYTRRSVLLGSAMTVAIAGCLDGEADDPANGEDPDSDGADSTPGADDSEPNGADDTTQDDEGATDDEGTTDDGDGDDGDTDRNDVDGDDQDGVDGDDEDVDATVVVGADGDLRFDPETLEIDPGAAVEFVWEAAHHNIAVTDQPDGADWDGVPETQDAGYTHRHTFEIEGRYEYVCEPHEGADMRGTVVVGGSDATDPDANGSEGDEDDGAGGGPGYGY